MEMTWLLAVVCIYVSWTDLRRREIPNRVLLAGLLLAALIGWNDWPREVWFARVGAGAGIVFAFGLIAWFWPEGLGMGDVKLLGLLGFALGLHAFVRIVTTACLAVLLTSLFLLLERRIARKSSLPFAPFLTLALLLAHFFA